MPSDEEGVLDANTRFYAAFDQRDVEGMDRVWSAMPSVACIHPGWEALHGRGEVMASWRAILSNPDAPRISCTEERVMVLGDAAFVVCVEQLTGGELLATNVFSRDDGEWRLVHHHAGPFERRSVRAPSSPAGTLH